MKRKILSNERILLINEKFEREKSFQWNFFRSQNVSDLPQVESKRVQYTYQPNAQEYTERILHSLDTLTSAFQM